MSSMEASDWITAAISLSALVVSGFAWWASHRSARASEQAAEAARRSAIAEESQLKLEQADRAEAAYERRTNVWSAKMQTMAHLGFTFQGTVAHNVRVEAQGELMKMTRKKNPSGPLHNRSTFMAELPDPANWDRIVVVCWTETPDQDAEVLRRQLVL